MRLTGTGIAKVRANMSVGHLRHAAYQAGGCRPLERNYTWPATEPVLTAHASMASSGVILSACALEAGVNELHLAAVDGTEPSLGYLFPHAEQIVELWDTVERGSLLRKYQWFLTLAGLPPMPPGQQPLQGASDLIELRDALVHWKPEWSNDPKYSERIERRLAGKFPLNALSMPDQLFIPYRGCGYGAACWAVKSAEAFLLAFAALIGVTHPLEKHTEEIAAFLAIDAV